VEAVLAIINHPDAHLESAINLCTGTSVSFIELAEKVCDVVGYKPTLKFLSDRPVGALYRVGDPSIMNKYYTPKITLEQGIKEAVEFYETNTGKY